MKKSKSLKMLLLNVLIVCISATSLLGTTFAWFTDTATSQGNVLASGTLDVKAYWMDGALDPEEQNSWKNFNDGAVFSDGNVEPGYVVSRHVKIANEGSLAFKYKMVIVPNGTVSALADVIDVYYILGATIVNRASLQCATPVGTLREMIEDPDGAVYGILLPKNATAKNETEAVGEVDATIALKMREDVGNEYQGISIGESLDLKIYATQYAYEEDGFGSDYDQDATYPAEPSVWDGNASIAWFLENPEAEIFTLNTAQDLAGLVQLVDGSAEIPTPANVEDEITLPVTFEGKTIILNEDVDLLTLDENGEVVCFDPIGSYRQEKVFKGTFDGQGHVIKNLNQNTWALNNGYYYGDLGLGLFGCVEDAHIKNLVMDNASISGESAICGVVAAASFGDTTFENIVVRNSECADYQYYAGGIVGWAGGNQKFINCTVEESTTVAAQWGDFDNSIGGVIGGASGSSTILMKDCTVACRIDAYNDVTSSYQWYAYRRAGMLIGNTNKTIDVDGSAVADAPQLTCENVTVIYSDWANYTYCEFAGTSWPYVRVQAGVSNSAYSNPRYGHPTDANGNEVVDDNHVHNDGEDHQILCVFDQLYGGGQGVCGNPSHNGVNVVYNNK